MLKVKVFEMMAKRGIRTRKNLANKMEITESNVGRIVNGEIKAIRLDTLEKLCLALNCQPGDLFEYIPDEAVL